MKAAVQDHVGGPAVLRYVEVRNPQCLANAIVTLVEAFSLEDVDLVHCAGSEPPHPAHVGWFAAAGVVVMVRSAVRDRLLGQRVATVGMYGSHSVFRSVPARRSWIVPEGPDLPAAAAVPIAFGAAYDCIEERGTLAAGERVSILARGRSGSAQSRSRSARVRA